MIKFYLPIALLSYMHMDIIRDIMSLMACMWLKNSHHCIFDPISKSNIQYIQRYIIFKYVIIITYMYMQITRQLQGIYIQISSSNILHLVVVNYMVHSINAIVHELCKRYTTIIFEQITRYLVFNYKVNKSNLQIKCKLLYLDYQIVKCVY